MTTASSNSPPLYTVARNGLAEGCAERQDRPRGATIESDAGGADAWRGTGIAATG